MARKRALRCVRTAAVMGVTGMIAGWICVSAAFAADVVAWTPQSTGAAATPSVAAPYPLQKVSCPVAGTCWTTGDGGLVLQTSNDGLTWGRQLWLGPAVNLSGVSCPNTTSCWAVVRMISAAATSLSPPLTAKTGQRR